MIEMSQKRPTPDECPGNFGRVSWFKLRTDQIFYLELNWTHLGYFSQFCIFFIIVRIFIWNNSIVPWWSYIQGTILRRYILKGMDFETHRLNSTVIKIMRNQGTSKDIIEKWEVLFEIQILNMFHLKIGIHQSSLCLMIQKPIAPGHNVGSYHGHNLSKLTWWPSKMVRLKLCRKLPTVRFYCFDAASWNHLVIAAVKIKVYVLWIGQL